MSESVGTIPGGSGQGGPQTSGNSSSESSTEVQDPTKIAAGGATSEDPDFEYEIETKDKEGKPAKEKKKLKLSEARSRFASFDDLEGKVRGRETLVEKYIKEQLEPLNATVEQIRKDPSLMHDFAKRLGVDFDKAVQIYAQRQIDLSKMTPEQRELAATKEELANFKREKEMRAQEETSRAQREAVERESSRVQTEIISEANAAGLPKDASVLMMMTGFLRTQVARGEQPNTKAAAGYVKNVLDGGFKSMLKGLTYDQMEKDYPEILTKIREGDILKVRGGFAGNPARPPPKPTARQSRPIMSQSDLERHLRGED